MEQNKHQPELKEAVSELGIANHELYARLIGGEAIKFVEVDNENIILGEE